MKASIKAKSMLAFMLHRAGINSWKLRQHSGHDVAVLMYHRVIPREDMSPAVQAGMVVEPDTLDMHLKYLRDNFDIIPLSDLASDRRDNSPGPRARPACVLTFDDGWRDFYDHAYPVLKKHQAPATVFLPTDYIGTNRWFWTDRLGHLLDRISLSPDAVKSAPRFDDPLLGDLVRISGTPETRLEKTIALLKPLKIGKIEEVLTKLSAALGEDSTPAGRAFLTWEEAQEMSRSGLVFFGSHTAGHPLLTTLTEEQARHELRKSMDALIARKVTDTGFIPFCYPNGDFSEKLCDMVREAGYHLAVTTQYGWHRPGTNIHAIRRIAVHQDITATVAMFESRIVKAL